VYLWTNVGFVVNIVALGQVFLRVLRFSLSVSFHQVSILIYHLGEGQEVRWLSLLRDIVSPHRQKKSMDQCPLVYMIKT
jgi:hypothetical protein